MSITYIEIPDRKRVEFAVGGHISKADYQRIVTPMEAFIETHGTVQMIEVVDSFSGFDPAILLPGISLDIKAIPHISHIAVVTDIGWISPIARAVGALLPTRLRVFPRDGLEDARAWLDEVRAA
ncbi:STAS/SEC14 domain-containing protein [Marinovum sp.]|uniref:STAS/SEC14 domain-containing protein n=1 Tax=Marinovum sp. TaxID=2024839 RepID=UPI003A92A120